MKGSNARTATVAAEDALTAVRGSGVLAAAIVLAVGVIGVFAVLASGTSEPLVLTAMAVLSTIGVFFILAGLSGHLRLVGRMSDLEIASAAADAIDDGIQITSANGDTHYTSRVFKQFLGASVAGTARSLEEILAADPQSSQALFRLARASERGMVASETFCMFSRVGGEAISKWYRLSVKPWGSSAPKSGRGALTVWHLRDITVERGDATRQSSALSTTLALYDRMPVGLLAIDDAGAIEHLNATLRDWLGMSDAVRTRPIRLADLITADSAELVRALVRQRPGQAQPIEVDLQCPNGATLPARLLVIERAAGDATGSGFVAAVLKRSIEPSTLANLKTSGARFSRLFETAPFGIAMIGADGRITSANNAFSRLLLASGKVEGMAAIGLLGKEAVGGLRAPIETALASAIAQKSNIPPVEVTVGELGEFTRRVVMSALGPAASTTDSAVLYVMDATEQKTLEVNFAQSQKMEAVGKLAGGIAHDFNNVLTAIIGFSDLLLQTHRPSDAAYKNIMAIKSSANRAAGMVSQLLAFSRRQTLQPEILALGETLGDLSVLLNRLLGEKIDLKIHQGRDLWYVKADRSQLSQVVINLAVNARDAMIEGGTLKISTRNLTERESQKIEQPGFVVGEYVVIDVEDTGHGMSPEVMAKIFEPFFTTKGVGKGTGLGLSTVYGIVKQTGGFVFPESSPTGTTFPRLPAALPRRQHRRDHSPEVGQEGTRRRSDRHRLRAVGRGRRCRARLCCRGTAPPGL